MHNGVNGNYFLLSLRVCLFVCLCVCLTGKVHGSLARAGKVRGQTPKVGIENILFSTSTNLAKECTGHMAVMYRNVKLCLFNHFIISVRCIHSEPHNRILVSVSKPIIWSLRSLEAKHVFTAH